MVTRKTFGRGQGERKYVGIPISRYRKHTTCILFDPAHKAYPQSGSYARTPLKSPKK